MALSLLSLLLITVGILLGFFIALYFYFTRNFNFWKKRRIPYEKPLPFVGNLKEAIFQNLDIGQNLKQIYDKHKRKPYVGFFSFDQPSLLITDPDLVKCVLVKDAKNFVNRFQTADEKADPLTAKAVFALKDDKWRHIRLGMTPIFTTGKIKKMFYLVDKCAKEMALHMDKNITTEGKFFDLIGHSDILHLFRGKWHALKFYIAFWNVRN
jgi:cytochrome P450 family 6